MKKECKKGDEIKYQYEPECVQSDHQRMQCGTVLHLQSLYGWRVLFPHFYHL